MILTEMRVTVEIILTEMLVTV